MRSKKRTIGILIVVIVVLLGFAGSLLVYRNKLLSENAKKLSDEYKEKRGYIPWNAMYGLRNRIVHDYGNVDLNIVFETLKNDIPELLEMIKG